mgnify:CR=1 FL=1
MEISQIDLSRVPEHVAIIMDGNGRWAKQQGEMRLFGHNIGVESVRKTLKAAQQLKVKYLTLYAFSTENWNRPKEEVDGLMELLVNTIAGEADELHASGVRLAAIGDITGLPASCQCELQEAIKKTQENTTITLVLALNYSARWEIMNAVKNIAQEVKQNNIDTDLITEELFQAHLSTKDIPDPELLIRTSGEHRLSNFLLWQAAYTEFYFTPVLWPDFTGEHLMEAVYDFQNRERRFGMVSEQLI